MGLGLAGCEDLRQMVSARPEVVAEAAGQELTVERLALVMASVKGLPLTREAADVIANSWVEYALFAQSVTNGHDLGDSATAAAVLWPQLAEAQANHWHDSLVARMAAPGPGVPDSIYNQTPVRLLQHVLFRLKPGATPAQRSQARHKADVVRSRAQAGADFAALARAQSEDPGSKDSGGYLPAAPRNRWAPAFDSAGWRLKPGEISPVTETSFGFHVIRRPPLSEVRQRILDYVRSQVGAGLDSSYLHQLGEARHLRVERNAPMLMREALADRDRAREDSGTTLAVYDGGRLTVKDFMRWMTALGGGWTSKFVTEPDSSLDRFARTLGQNALLLAQADSARIRIPADEWAEMLQGYRAELDSLRAGFGFTGTDLTDPAIPVADRAKVATLRVDNYWDKIASGTVRPRPVPPELATELRRGASYRVSAAGLARSASLAETLRAAKDSADAVRKPVRPPKP
jgi:peptidyl-prolyl cis-trans isomerase D